MEGDKLTQLRSIRDLIEKLYADVIEEIRKEVLTKNLVDLMNTPGVMEYLDHQKLQDYLGEVTDEN